MKQYRITFLRVGHAFIMAENETEAVSLANQLKEAEIDWMPSESEHSKPYLLTFAEEIDS